MKIKTSIKKPKKTAETVAQSEKASPATKPTSAAVTVEWRKQPSTLSQVYSAGLEFCFVSKDFKQCCPFVFCKDFLQDALMSQHHGSAVSIYGFSYDPSNSEPIYQAKTRIGIANSSDDDFSNKVPNMVEFLNKIEKNLGLVRTRCRPVKNPPTKYKSKGVFILDGSNRWQLSPPMISMYSLLIRVGFTHKKGDSYEQTIANMLKTKKGYQEEDYKQLKDAESGINQILKYGYARIFFKDAIKNFPQISTHAMHNDMGIVAFSIGDTAVYVKHWSRDLDKVSNSKKKKE